MERSVWELKASLYDRYVTKTKYQSLREFLETEEKLLDRVLESISSNERRISLIEIGSGTGRTLFSYLTKRHILRQLVYLIGLDDAGAMYDRAKSKFRDLKDSGIISARDSEKFVFLYMNAVDMPRFFKDGRMNLRSIRSVYGGNTYIRMLKPRRYNGSFKVVINLLNTLGVMEEDVRSQVLRNMVLAAGPKGTIVVSVFDANCFKDIAPLVYGSIKRITGKFDRKAFDDAKHEFRTKTYYSHWFPREEISKSIEEAGAKVTKITPITTTLKGFFIVGET